MLCVIVKVYCQNFHCPTGQRYQVNKDEPLKEWFERNCQDHARQILNGCTWNWNNKKFGCETLIGTAMEKYGHKPACIIHDMCYESGRPRKNCDDELWNNLTETGMWTSNKNIVYTAVRLFGKLREKKC